MILFLPAQAQDETRLTGVLIVDDAAPQPPRTVPFLRIQWNNEDGGVISDLDGMKTRFSNSAVQEIVYWDPDYYDLVNHHLAWLDWRIGLQAHELVLKSFHLAYIAPSTIALLQTEKREIETIAHRFPSSGSVLEPMIAHQNEVIHRVDSGQIFENGIWVTSRFLSTASADGSVQLPTGNYQVATFSTKSGTQFVRLPVTLSETGLSVLTPDGGTTLPFDQLPDDLSGFPKKIQEQLRERRDSLAKAGTKSETASTRESTKSSPDSSATGNAKSISPLKTTSNDSPLPMSPTPKSPSQQDSPPVAAPISRASVEPSSPPSSDLSSPESLGSKNFFGAPPSATPPVTPLATPVLTVKILIMTLLILGPTLLIFSIRGVSLVKQVVEDADKTPQFYLLSFNLFKFAFLFGVALRPSPKKQQG